MRESRAGLIVVLVSMIFGWAADSSWATDKAVNRGIPGDQALVIRIGEIRPPLARQVELILSRAKELPIRYLVLVVDSPGGHVLEAEQLTSLLESAPYHRVAYVRRAISAAIWPVLACHEVVYEAGASIGGAQVYSEDESTGEVLVDAKITAIKAADTRALADKYGHPSNVAVSMVVAQPTGRTIVRRSIVWINSYEYVVRDQSEPERQVVTLTAQEAVARGLGKGVVPEITSLFSSEPHLVNEPLVNGLIYAEWLTRMMDEHIYGELYEPASLAARTPRRAVAGQRRTVGPTAVRTTTGGSRRLTDAELARERQRTEAVARTAVTRVRALRQEIAKFTDDPRLAVFRSAADREQALTRAITQHLRNQFRVVVSHFDQLSDMMVDRHADAVNEYLKLMNLFFDAMDAHSPSSR